MSLISIINSATDVDGRIAIRTNIASAGFSMYYAGPMWVAAKLNSVIWSKIVPQPPFTILPRNWATVKLYKPDGTETTVESEAGFTVVDSNVDRDVEVIGGHFDCSSLLPIGNGDSDWRLWCVAAPNVPQAYGGQIVFAEDIVLNGFKEGQTVFLDGRSTKLLPFSIPGLPDGEANKFRFILKHPTGLSPSTNPSHVARFQVMFEQYVKW